MIPLILTAFATSPAAIILGTLNGIERPAIGGPLLGFSPNMLILDAGANVHVLYPSDEKETVLDFIKKELAKFCQNEHYICDHTGLGANQIED